MLKVGNEELEENILYAEVVIDSVNNRNNFYPVSELPALYAEHAGKEIYRSYFLYNEKPTTAKTYVGGYTLDRIVFDIDVKDSKDKMSAIRAFVEQLNADWNIPQDLIQAYFSGTGFHVVIPDVFHFPQNHKDLPALVRATLTSLFPTVDNLFYNTSIVREYGSFNKKSELYKISLTLNDIFNLSYEEIQILAGMYPRRPAPEVPSTSFRIEYDIKPQPEHEPSATKPSSIVTCVQNMFEKGPIMGQRHQMLLRIASAWHRAGVPQEATLTALSKWIKRGPAPHVEHEELRQIVSSVYSGGKGDGLFYGCNDTLMHQFCESKCIFYKNKNYGPKLLYSSDIEKSYHKFINTNFEYVRFSFGDFYPSIGNNYVYPGELIIVQGDTGLSKTALVQNWCVRLPHFKIIFFTLELHPHLLFRRFIQIAHNMTKEQVVDYYKHTHNCLSDSINHIIIADSAPSIPAIRKLIAEQQPQLVVIDTTDGIEAADYKEDTARGSYVAKSLKEIAQHLDTIIIGVHHINKISASGTAPMSVHSGKGSSSFGQKADKVILVQGKQKESMRRLSTAKARDEAPFDVWVNVSDKTFTANEVLPSNKKVRLVISESGKAVEDVKDITLQESLGADPGMTLGY